MRRAEQRGFRDDHIHGSKRSLRSVEDFTEFEQRTAYFNGDQIHAIKKGMNILDRIQVTHMAQMQPAFGLLWHMLKQVRRLRGTARRLWRTENDSTT